MFPTGKKEEAMTENRLPGKQSAKNVKEGTPIIST